MRTLLVTRANKAAVTTYALVHIIGNESVPKIIKMTQYFIFSNQHFGYFKSYSFRVLFDKIAPVYFI